MIRIAIVEDDEDFRTNFIELVREEVDFDLIGVYENAEDFIAENAVQNADVVIMDIGLPGMSGVNCVMLQKPLNSSVQFCMYTVFDDDYNIYNALCAGATGYLLKNSSAEDLVSGIRSIYLGGSPMTSSIARKVMEAFVKGRVKTPETPQKTELSEIENKIMEMIASGYKFSVIGELLSLAQKQVMEHIRCIYTKLQANSRTEAISAFQEQHDRTYKSSYITTEQQLDIVQRLNQIFKNSELFLHCSLTISQVASKLGAPVYAVSQAINTQIGMNFFDYVNQWRVDYAAEMLITENGNRFSIESIGYDAGFGSKASFYSAFKKRKGCTPLEWRLKQS